MSPKLFGWDSETYLILPGLLAPKLVCGSWADADTSHVTTPADMVQFFRDTLTRGDHLVGINLAYDIVVLAAHDPTLLPLIFKAGNAGLLHDCSIREALNDIALGKLEEKSDDQHDWNRYGMAVLMWKHFNTDISAEKTGDVWRYKYAQLDGVPLADWPQAALDYPKADARRTYDVCIRQRDYQNKHDEPAQVRASIAIQLMCAWGLRTDGAYVADLDLKVDKVWNEARELFTREGLFRADGSKDMEYLRQRVYDAYKGRPPLTPGGQISTDRDTLEESGDPLLVKLGTAGKNDKRKTTYIPKLKLGIDRPINPNFNVLVATGRVSSDWQQMPQKGFIREGVHARPHTVISSNDLGGAELRTMSQRAILDPDIGFSKMAEFLNAGKDTHSHVAAQFLGITYEAFLARKVELDGYRKVGKIWNFGKGGGAGAFAMAYNAKVKENIRLCLTLKRAAVCGEEKTEGFIMGKAKRVCTLCVQIAKELGEKWLDAWPEQRMLVEKASRLTRNQQKVDSVTFGSNRVRGQCGFTQWLNNPFQSAVGDGVKAAMWRIQELAYTDRSSPLWDSRLLLNVHDELWTEHPDDNRRHEAAYLVAQILCEEMDRITPDVKNEVEPALVRRPFKAAAKALDRNGRLRPWWPADWDQVWPADRAQMLADMSA